MNVLFVNNFKGRGGGEEFLRDLLPGLVKKGIKVGLVCRPDMPLFNMMQNTSVILHPVDRRGIQSVLSVFKIAKTIREHNYAIINIQRGHDIMQALIAALISLKKVKLLYTPQVPQFIRSRFLLSRMDRIVTISRHIKDAIIDYSKGLKKKIDIIYYGIDVSLFDPQNTPKGGFRQKIGVSSSDILIGTVGDLWKNQMEFLDALPEIRTVFPEARFVLVASTGSVEQFKFQEKADKLGVGDAIVWAGRLAKEEICSFYADINLAVCTHRNEGFGIWVLEALAMGKPVVAFNAGGVRDSLENCPAGVLVDGGPADMACEIIELLRDEKRLASASTEGPRWINTRFNRDRMIDDYVAYFAKV